MVNRHEAVDARVFNAFYGTWWPLAPFSKLSWDYTADWDINSGSVSIPKDHPLAPMFIRARDGVPVPLIITVNGVEWTGQVTNAERSQDRGAQVWKLTLASDHKHVHRLLAKPPAQSAADSTETRLAGYLGDVTKQVLSVAAARTGLPTYLIIDHEGDPVELQARTEHTVAEVLSEATAGSDSIVDVRMALPGGEFPGEGAVELYQGDLERVWADTQLAAGMWPDAATNDRLEDKRALGTPNVPLFSWDGSGTIDIAGKELAEPVKGIAWRPFQIKAEQDGSYFESRDEHRARVMTAAQLAAHHEKFGMLPWFVTEWTAGTFDKVRDHQHMPAAIEAGLLVWADGTLLTDVVDVYRRVGTAAAYAWNDGTRWVLGLETHIVAERNKRRANGKNQKVIPGLMVHLRPERDRRGIVFSSVPGGGLTSWAVTHNAPEAAMVIAGAQMDQLLLQHLESGEASEQAVYGTRGAISPSEALALPGVKQVADTVESVVLDVQPQNRLAGTDVAFHKAGSKVDMNSAGLFFYREQYLNLNSTSVNPVAEMSRKWAEAQGSTSAALTVGATTNCVFGNDITDDEGRVIPGWRPGDRVSFVDEGTRISELIIGYRATVETDKPLSVTPIIGRKDNGVLAQLGDRLRGAENQSTKASLSAQRRLTQTEFSQKTTEVTRPIVEEVEEEVKEVKRNALTGAVIEYAVGASDTTAPTAGWSADTPTRQPGLYTWMRTVLTNGDGRTTTTSPVLVTGNDGEQGRDGAPGNNGIGISSTVVLYALGAQGNIPPNAGWASAVPDLVKGQWLWTRIIWTYTNGVVETGHSVAYLAVDGTDGEDGLPGKDGFGVTGTVISYAVSTSGTNPPTSGWFPEPPAAAEGSYVWTRTVWTYSDQTTETGYSVGKIGDRGPQGVAGAPGEDGQPTYTWIRYADSETGAGISNSPTGKTYIGFAYNKTTAQESNKASDYVWSLIKGEQGDRGVQGPAGKDGQPTYTWIKYADVPDGLGMYDTPKESTRFIGIAPNQTTAEEGNDPEAYTWSFFRGQDGADGAKGDKGDQGVSVSSVTPYYRYVTKEAAAPAKPTTATPTGWATTEPEWVSNRDLYQTMKVLYSNGSFAYTDVSKISSYTAAENALGVARDGVERAKAINLALTGNIEGNLADAVNDADTTIGAIKAAAEAAQSNFDNLQVGGRNLLSESEKPDAHAVAPGITKEMTSEGLKLTVGSVNDNYVAFSGGAPGLTAAGKELSDGEIVTFSVEIKSPDSTHLPNFYGNNLMPYRQMEGEVGTSFSRIYCTREYKKSGWQLHLGFSDRPGIYILRNFKLERGNKATDWTPAPEDVNTVASDAAQQVAQTAIGNIQVGGRNLLLGSKLNKTASSYLLAQIPLAPDHGLAEGDEFTVSIKGGLGSDRVAFVLYNSGGNVQIISLKPDTKGSDGVYRATGQWKVSTASNTSVNLYGFNNSGTSESTIEWVKIERGNKATDWSPAPEDMDVTVQKANAADKWTKDNQIAFNNAVSLFTAAQSKVNNVNQINWETQAERNALQAEIDEAQNTLGRLAFPHLNIAPAASNGRPYWSYGGSASSIVPDDSYVAGDYSTYSYYATLGAFSGSTVDDAFFHVTPGIDLKVGHNNRKRYGNPSNIGVVSIGFLDTNGNNAVEAWKDGASTSGVWFNTAEATMTSVYGEWLSGSHVFRIKPGVEKVRPVVRPSDPTYIHGLHISAWFPVREDLDKTQELFRESMTTRVKPLENTARDHKRRLEVLEAGETWRHLGARRGRTVRDAGYANISWPSNKRASLTWAAGVNFDVIFRINYENNTVIEDAFNTLDDYPGEWGVTLGSDSGSTNIRSASVSYIRKPGVGMLLNQSVASQVIPASTWFNPVNTNGGFFGWNATYAGRHAVSLNVEWEAATADANYAIGIYVNGNRVKELVQSNLGPLWPWEDGRRTQTLEWEGDLKVSDQVRLRMQSTARSSVSDSKARRMTAEGSIFWVQK